jgi:hypothetical protein
MATRLAHGACSERITLVEAKETHKMLGPKLWHTAHARERITSAAADTRLGPKPWWPWRELKNKIGIERTQ